jgi:hypothetical protein
MGLWSGDNAVIWILLRIREVIRNFLYAFRVSDTACMMHVVSLTPHAQCMRCPWHRMHNTICVQLWKVQNGDATVCKKMHPVSMHHIHPCIRWQCTVCTNFAKIDSRELSARLSTREFQHRNSIPTSEFWFCDQLFTPMSLLKHFLHFLK